MRVQSGSADLSGSPSDRYPKKRGEPMRTFFAFLGSLGLASMLAVATPVLAQPKPGDKPLATRELDVEGVVAEVIESDRKDGVLAVRVRFRNNGDKPAKLSLVDAQGYVHTYVVSGNTRYPLLKDETGKQVATPRDGGGWLEPKIAPKASWNWWGKFPAPPADHKAYSLYLKVGPPIDGIPIVDKP